MLTRVFKKSSNSTMLGLVFLFLATAILNLWGQSLLHIFHALFLMFLVLLLQQQLIKTYEFKSKNSYHLLFSLLFILCFPSVFFDPQSLWALSCLQASLLIVESLNKNNSFRLFESALLWTIGLMIFPPMTLFIMPIFLRLMQQRLLHLRAFILVALAMATTWLIAFVFDVYLDTNFMGFLKWKPSYADVKASSPYSWILLLFLIINTFAYTVVGIRWQGQKKHHFHFLLVWLFWATTFVFIAQENHNALGFLMLPVSIICSQNLQHLPALKYKEGYIWFCILLMLVYRLSLSL